MDRRPVATMAEVCDQLTNECYGLAALVGSVSAAMVGMSSDPDVSPPMRRWLRYTGFQLDDAVRVMGDIVKVVEGHLEGRYQFSEPEGAAV